MRHLFYVVNKEWRVIMYCKFCGKDLPDQAKFCNGCGGKQEHPEVVESKIKDSSTTVFQTTPGTSGDKGTINNLKAIIIGAIALVAIILIFLLTKSSYKDPLDDIAKSLNKQQTDITKYMKIIAPEFVSDTYKDALALVKDIDKDTYKEATEQIEDGLSLFYEGLEDYLGDDYKFSYKIKSKDKLDKDDLEDIEDSWRAIGELLEDYDDDYFDDMFYYSDLSSSQEKKVKNLVKDLTKNLTKLEVTSGYELTVKLSIKGVDKDEVEDLLDDLGFDELEFDVNVIKVNGDWCIDTISLLSDLGYLNRLLYNLDDLLY